jgi:hypothetical protein
VSPAYCGRCERLVSRRSARAEVESWRDFCRAVVPVAVKVRGVGLVRRAELAAVLAASMEGAE